MKPYHPPPTLEKFMLDDEHRIRVAVGPFGSGKSMCCIMELLRRSCEQRAYNGVRYTRWACIRNTLKQLRQTVLSDIQQYLGPIVRHYVTDATLQLRMALPDGTSVHSDWMMLPLDTQEDTQRLLSLQLTGAWVNELREVPYEIIRPLLGRTGRYPSKAMGGYTWRGIIADSNPWDIDSPYHDKLVLNPHPKWALYHQPSGIAPGAENAENLPEGYYEDLMDGKDPEWSYVHVESQWGSSNAGQAVFRRSFHAPSHVREMNVVVNPNRPLLVGLDFGRTPVALIGQVDNFGRALIFKEVLGDCGLVQFLREQLKPVLAESPFAGKRVLVVADPAGMQKSQHTELTAFDILKDEGFQAYPAATNDIDKRLLAFERLLRANVAGEAGLQINRAGCPMLVQALGSKYRYRRRKDGEIEDKPEKSHPWSDLADAGQYFAFGVHMNVVGRVVAREQRLNTAARASVRAAGWT